MNQDNVDKYIMSMYLSNVVHKYIISVNKDYVGTQVDYFSVQRQFRYRSTSFLLVLTRPSTKTNH